MNLKINRNWRQWKGYNDTHAPRVVVGSEGESGVSQTPRLSNKNTPNSFKIKKVSNAKLNSKSNKKYDAGKELYANNKYVSKNGKKQEYDKRKIEESAREIVRKINEGGSEKENLKMEQRLENIYDFESQLDYSIYNSAERDCGNTDSKVNKQQQFKPNEHEAESLGISYFKSRNRRYGTEFANLIGKLAEDNTGADIQGDEFWDEHLLTERVVTRQSINKCKKDRIKERIVLMLDTSPSCARVAGFYGLIAEIAAKYDDIEMYDAPNGRIVHKYCRRTKDFVPIWNEEDIQNRAYQWKYLKNRTVLIFSDSDCFSTIRENLGVNNIILMSHRGHDYYGHRHSSALKRIAKEIDKFGGNTYLDVDTPDKLVEVIKKLK